MDAIFISITSYVISVPYTRDFELKTSAFKVFDEAQENLIQINYAKNIRMTCLV